MAPPERWVVIGVVARPHGVRGELRIKLFNTESDVLLDQREVQVGPQLRKVLGARRERDSILLRIEGCAGRDAADALRGLSISVPRGVLPPTDPDEFYLIDLVGLEAFGPGGARIGAVAHVAELPAHAVLIIERESLKLEVPLAEEFLEEVDLEGRRIRLRAIEDLPGYAEICAGERS